MKCKQQVLFSASKREQFWLETGENSMYGGPNGTAPVVEISSATPQPFVTIQLGAQGGKIEFTIWDRATKSFIEAGLIIERADTADKVFPAIYISTRARGQSHSLLLPKGQYSIRLNYFNCRGKRYFARNFPPEPFEVVPGEWREKELQVDVSKLDVRPSYANLSGEKCEL